MEKLEIVEKNGKYILGYYIDTMSDEPYFMECEYVDKDYTITKQDYANWLYG